MLEGVGANPHAVVLAGARCAGRGNEFSLHAMHPRYITTISGDAANSSTTETPQWQKNVNSAAAIAIATAKKSTTA